LSPRRIVGSLALSHRSQETSLGRCTRLLSSPDFGSRSIVSICARVTFNADRGLAFDWQRFARAMGQLYSSLRVFRSTLAIPQRASDDVSTNAALSSVATGVQCRRCCHNCRRSIVVVLSQIGGQEADDFAANSGPASADSPSRIFRRCGNWLFLRIYTQPRRGLEVFAGGHDDCGDVDGMRGNSVIFGRVAHMAAKTEQ